MSTQYCVLAARALDIVTNEGLTAAIEDYESGVFSFWDECLIDNPHYEIVCYIFNQLKAMNEVWRLA